MTASVFVPLIIQYLVIFALIAKPVHPLLDLCQMNDTPETPEEIGTTFMLYNRETGRNGNGQNLRYDDADSLRSSLFNKDLDTLFLVHGYKSSTKSWWIENLKDAMLEKQNANFIYVDWKNGADVSLMLLDYTSAARNTRVVGEEIAKLCIALMDTLSADHKKFHIVGFSLGAHVAGAAGHYFQERTDEKVARITGLDPAGLCFANAAPAEMALDKHDADFVDVIHTDCGTIGMGMGKPIGDVDFYPHGCKLQPGCTKISITCNHFRAPDLFVDSIQNSRSPMLGSKCRSYAHFVFGKCYCKKCAHLGYYADPKKTGIYYLHTASEAPFGQNN